MPPKSKAAVSPASKQNKASEIVGNDPLELQQDDSLLEAVPPPSIPSEPTLPIQQSYTWASPVPSECSRTHCSAPSIKVPCVLGVDEAGRGPVLGPLVYGIAYCPVAYQDEMKQIGFADSKALTAERRDALLSALMHHSSHLGWAVRVMSPQDISAGMLRRRPINLNAQSSQATVSLIAGVLEQGVDLTEIYVDTVGDPKSYAKLLSSHFPRHPHIKWTVTSKADAIYPIVGAASIAAKVTRDRCIEKWRYAEQEHPRNQNGQDVGLEPGEAAVLSDTTNHLSPLRLQAHLDPKKRKADDGTELALDQSTDLWSNMGALGSGYPGDPNTVAFLKRSLDPVFGWPGIVRFSWATAKTMLEEKIKPPATSARSADPTSSPSSVQTFGRKRLTRSLSRTSSFTDTQPSTVPAPRPMSLYGTLLPQPSIPGGTAARGYKVKWIDEPVSISKFFGPTSAKKPSVNANASSANISASSAPQQQKPETYGPLEVSPLQGAVNEWLKAEAQWRAKKNAAHSAVDLSTAQIQLNVGKLVKDLGLTSGDASFCL